MTTLRTPRLTIRPWTEADRAAFFALNLDPRVGEWLGGPFSEDQVEAMFARALAAVAAEDWIWAAERHDDGAVIGLMMLRRVTAEGHAMAGAVEIGWRFVPEAWGGGYATEAARAVLGFGFAELDEAEIVAFTATTNLRSQAVMTRLGLVRDEARDFDHPALAEGHPLRRHVVFAIGRILPR